MAPPRRPGRSGVGRLVSPAWPGRSSAGSGVADAVPAGPSDADAVRPAMPASPDVGSARPAPVGMVASDLTAPVGMVASAGPAIVVGMVVSDGFAGGSVWFGAGLTAGWTGIFWVSSPDRSRGTEPAVGTGPAVGTEMRMVWSPADSRTSGAGRGGGGTSGQPDSAERAAGSSVGVPAGSAPTRPAGPDRYRWPLLLPGEPAVPGG